MSGQIAVQVELNNKVFWASATKITQNAERVHIPLKNAHPLLTPHFKRGSITKRGVVYRHIDNDLRAGAPPSTPSTPSATLTIEQRLKDKEWTSQKLAFYLRNGKGYTNWAAKSSEYKTVLNRFIDELHNFGQQFQPIAENHDLVSFNQMHGLMKAHGEVYKLDNSKKEALVSLIDTIYSENLLKCTPNFKEFLRQKTLETDNPPTTAADLEKLRKNSQSIINEVFKLNRKMLNEGVSLVAWLNRLLKYLSLIVDCQTENVFPT